MVDGRSATVMDTLLSLYLTTVLQQNKRAQVGRSLLINSKSWAVRQFHNCRFDLTATERFHSLFGQGGFGQAKRPLPLG